MRFGLIDIGGFIGEIISLIVFLNVEFFELYFFHLRFSCFEQAIKHPILFFIFGQQQRLVVAMIVGFRSGKMSIMTIFTFVRIRNVKTPEFRFGESREDGVVFGDQVGRDEFKTCDALNCFGVEF